MQSDKAFTGSIPALYEMHLVPMFFEPYARDLTKRVAPLKPRRMLELAAGTGAVTRHLAEALPHTEIVASDLNEPMITLGRSATAGGHVSWRQADAMDLPFGNDAFDAIVCQFGVMFFPDKAVAYREAHRVLKPGGRYIFNVWGPLAENDFANAVHEAVAAVFPDDPPRFFEQGPHGYSDVAVIRAALAEAGFTDIAAESVNSRSMAPSAADAATGLCQGTPLRNQIEARNPERLEAATRAAAEALTRQFGPGAIEGRMQAIVVQATRPAEA